MKMMNKKFKIKMDLVGSYYHSLGSDKVEEVGIYSDMLEVLAKRLRNRIKDHYQNVVVITGGTGSGKSTLAIKLAKMIDPDWDLRENFIYSAGDLARKLNHKETANPISLYDEGSVIFNSLNFNKKEDKQLVILFDTMRSLGWTSIICLPNIKNLNSNIKDTHLTYHLVCPDKPLVKGYERRGFFEVYTPVRYQWSAKIYDRLLSAGTFSKLSKSLDEEYQSIKLDKQMSLIESFVKDNLKVAEPVEDES